MKKKMIIFGSGILGLLVILLCAWAAFFRGPAPQSHAVENMDTNEAMQNLFSAGSVVFSDEYIYYISGDFQVCEYEKKTAKTRVLVKENTFSSYRLLLDDSKLYFSRNRNRKFSEKGGIASYDLNALKYTWITPDEERTNLDEKGNHATLVPSKYGVIRYREQKGELAYLSGEVISNLNVGRIKYIYAADDELYYTFSIDEEYFVRCINLKTKEEQEILSVFKQIPNLGLIEIKEGVYVPNVFSPKSKGKSERDCWSLKINERCYQLEKIPNLEQVNMSSHQWAINEYDMEGTLLQTIETFPSSGYIKVTGLYVYKKELYVQIYRLEDPRDYIDLLDEKSEELDETNLEHITGSIYKVNIN